VRKDRRVKVDLTNKVFIVTGAASGIGAAIARCAIEAGAGGLLLTDRDVDGLDALARELGAAFVVAELADTDAPARIAEAARDRFGRIDGLVNAAGLTTRAGLSDATPEVWDNLFAVNARAPFFLMQAAVSDMLARGASGAIVNILSLHAHCGASDLAIYSGSKGALATLTKNAAQAYLADRIRVNGINLGWVATPAEHVMQTQVLGRGADWMVEEVAKMPLGRFLQASEVAQLAVFLLSDQSVPMTGVLMDFEQRVTGAVL
jgi:NAD(P)-dependent dehydrogenase (short-subunit alcohol dehydrogenase family)